MSLKKKIAIWFIISVFITFAIVAYRYFVFVQLKREIRFLEVTDTIRSKSLQWRRHEKNFFLYGSTNDDEESREVHRYLGELKEILRNAALEGYGERVSSFEGLIGDYGRRFDEIESSLKSLSAELDNVKTNSMGYRQFYPLIELTFRERPRETADFLEQVFLLPPRHRLVVGLRMLDSEMAALRKRGEDILVASKDLDRLARENAESMIYRSLHAMLVLIGLFLIVGLGALFYITSHVVSKLEMLTRAVSKTGKGFFSPIPVSQASSDEVGVLIRTFNDMQEQLTQREKELIQSKKLAAIGTLASGVAHELNNPLNNIYTTSQRLMKKAGGEYPPFIKKSLNDIFSETMRVKKIVGDLLEFARGRDPHFRPIELGAFISDVYRYIKDSVETGAVSFSLSLDPGEVVVDADQELLEQVFINLFTNAVEAMSGAGSLAVTVDGGREEVVIKVSDTGKGMPAETVEKIFEPFYTTKNKGTGLGLAIVFNIIQKHNGRITAESEAGRGTTLTIVLPKRAAQNESDRN
jgi:two-component system, NtrC family, sensor kinase